MVWFTAMGLALGIGMIVILLGFIFIKGIEVFWPKRVLQAETQTASGENESILGELVLKQTKRGREGLHEKKEWQFFLGNREVLGQSFRFIEEDRIHNVRYPEDAVVLERMEYGDAIGYPVALVIPGDGTFPSNSPDFSERLEQEVAKSNRRWKEIRRIEKTEIGKINSKLERIALKEKELQKKIPDPERLRTELGALANRKAALQGEYQALADKAKLLRQKQKEAELRFRLAQGEERAIEVGQILHFYYPNRLQGLERLGEFFRNLGVFLSEAPREANTEGGVFPALFGTLVMTVLMSLAVVPFGVLGAIYLHEYAKPGIIVRLVRIAVNNLAGVPSIVFGVFGLGFLVYSVGGTLDALFFSDRLPTPTFGTGGLLWASLTLALMTVPVVVVSTEEALSSVSRGIREGALACGASKWQTVKNILLPAAAPGILTGTILAMARGAGEVAPLMLVGVVKLAPTLPINGTFPYLHLDQKFMHLGFHIFDLGFQSPDSEAAKPMVFATTLLLIALVLILNLGAIILRERLRKKYAVGAF